MPSRPANRHRQEWLLIADALAPFVGDPDDARTTHHDLIQPLADQEERAHSARRVRIDDEWVSRTGQSKHTFYRGYIGDQK